MYYPIAAQVKQKFGSLRFYIDGGDEIIYNYISFAEYLSGYICEQCGTTENVGSTQWPAWILTLCENCAIKSKKIDVWKKNE